MKTKTANEVTPIPAAPPEAALRHFEARLSFETDCADVHATEGMRERGYVLLDVRSKALFEAGHLPGASHLPHSEIDEERLAAFGRNAAFVVYCSGPHCNGASRAAVQLARLGRSVKEMIGGGAGWRDEGFALETP